MVILFYFLLKNLLCDNIIVVNEKMESKVLAFMGDAVYELYIRKYLIDQNICNVNDLQRMCVKFVSAERQCYFVEKMIDEDFLTADEIEIFKRGRNASSHSSRSTDIITYKKATGLESLIGYLYFNKKFDRVKEIMDYIVGVEWEYTVRMFLMN